MDLDFCPASPCCAYAVVVSDYTRVKWKKALEALMAKYEKKWPGSIKAVVWGDGDDLSSSLPSLSMLKPTYTCFLAHHTECGKDYVQQVHRLTRLIDPSTPYTDTVWGILTGLTEDDCIKAISHDPLQINRATGNCPIPLDKFNSGVWFSESEQGVAFRKSAGSHQVSKEKCHPDATEPLLEEMGSNHTSGRGVDMIITSGHATESELNLGYCFRSGQIRCSEGHICGHSLDGAQYKLALQDDRPRILSAAGNCLMGHVRDEHSMAIAWLHSAGVVQMLGYVVPTWFGYAGWGVHKYFINNPGMMSFSEAYYANIQSLIARLTQLHPDKAEVQDHRSVYGSKFGKDIHDRNEHEITGLTYDSDTTVLYGDPAWEARLERKLDLWDYTIKIESIPSNVAAGSHEEEEAPNWNYWEFTVETLKPGRWDCPCADDKSTSPGRPPFYRFPFRASSVKLVSGNAIVTCNFILMNLTGEFEAREIHKVKFATSYS